MTQVFSKSEAIKFGWQKTKENFLPFFLVLLIYFILSFVPLFIVGFASGFKETVGELAGQLSPLMTALTFFGQLFSFILTLSFFKMSLKAVDGQKVTLGDMFYRPFVFFKYLLSSLMFTAVIYAGLILLIVPGIIFSIRLQFYGLFIVEGDGPLEALKKSWAITKGSGWNLFLFQLLLALLGLFGFLALLIGWFLAAPTALIAWVYVYRQLQKQHWSTAEDPLVAQPVFARAQLKNIYSSFLVFFGCKIPKSRQNNSVILPQFSDFSREKSSKSP